MKQNLCARESGAEIALLVSEASPLTPRRELNESEQANSPGTIRRDNIDGCESEKDSSDIGERTNAGFSGDEDEDTCVFKVETAKGSQIGDPTNNAMFNTNLCETPDAKEELESYENDTTTDQNGDLTLNLKSVNGPLGAKSQDASDHLGATVDQGPTVNDHNDTAEIGAAVIGRDHFSVPNQDDATVLRSDPILEPTTEGIEIPLKNLSLNVVLDDNENFTSPKGVEESNLADRNSEENHSMPALQGEEKINSSDRTLDSVELDARVEAKSLVLNEESAEDAPAYKKKLQRKKDKKKNDKIEKTFFV